MIEQPSYYAVIPANVRYDKRLPSKAPLLYGEITALCNKEGVCWASDDYFMNLYEVSKSTIQSWLKSLDKNGYIDREVILKKDSKEIDKRYIRISDRVYRKTGIPYTDNLENPMPKNRVDNITNNNNTSINKEVEDAPEKNESESPTLEKKSFELWQNNWGFPNAIAQQDLHEWINNFGDELVTHAIEYALRSNVTSRGADRYLWKVFDDYKKYKITTVEQALKKEEEHQQQKSREYAAEKTRKTNYRQPVEKEKLPEWAKEGYVAESAKTEMSEEEREALKKKLSRFRKKEI
ncbi:MAG: helix-turn-helix domain-containing protein [Liquorilactobacillus hordei]|uniref:DnaD domain protein n=1 Tax=Liquorilactobacillus hordei TaxID=468911 RepID=UPI0039EABD39